MRTIWELVNQDLVQYREQGFSAGYRIGVEGMDLPHDVSVLNLYATNPYEYSVLYDALLSGHTKGINTFLSRSVEGSRVA